MLVWEFLKQAAQQFPFRIGIPLLGVCLFFLHYRFLKSLGRFAYVFPSYITKKRLLNRAEKDKKKLAEDILLNNLTKEQQVKIALLGLLPERKLKEEVMQDIQQGPDAEKIEVYSDRGQGKSMFLTQLAVSIKEHRPVILFSWNKLKDGLEGDEIPSYKRIRLELQASRFLINGKLNTPLIIIDDFPPKNEDSEIAENFKRQLDKESLPYIIGTRRYRLYPGFQEHTGWLRSSKQFELTLEEEEAVTIASTWRKLVKSERPGDVKEWCKEHKDRYKKQLFALLALLDDEAQDKWSGDESPTARPLVDKFNKLDEGDREVAKAVAFSQLFNVPLPSDFIKHSFPRENLERAKGTYDGLIRRDIERSEVFRSSSPVYHFGGPVLPHRLLEIELESSDNFYEFCKSLVGRSLDDSAPDDVCAYWRFVLNRMFIHWNPTLDRLNQQELAKKLYKEEMEGKLQPPGEMRKRLTKLAWASFFRKFESHNQAKEIYSSLWGSRSELAEDEVIFKASLFIGIADVLPAKMTEESYLTMGLGLANKYEPRTPRLALKMAKTFANLTTPRNEYLEEENEELLLKKAEYFSKTATKNKITTQIFHLYEFHVNDGQLV